MSTFKTNQQATIMRVQQTPAFFIHSSIRKEVQQESTFEVRSFGVCFFHTRLLHVQIYWFFLDSSVLSSLVTFSSAFPPTLIKKQHM